MATEDTKPADQLDTEKNQAETPQSNDEISDAELDQVAGGKAH